jgi:hypothetical protein
MGMAYGVFTNSSGVPDATTLANLCNGTVDPYAYLAANFTVHSFYRLNDAGTWADASGNFGNGTILNAVSNLGIIAASPNLTGAALTINDAGPYATYPVALGGSTGTIKLSGTYNTGLLGGAPANIQAQISTTPGGSAISGCGGTCAWANVTGQTIAGGVWSSSIAAVPPGGPYYVSIRASNGTSYVVNSDPVYVGLVIGVVGQSEIGTLFLSSYTGNTLQVPAGLQATIVGQTDQATNVGLKPGLTVAVAGANWPTANVGITPVTQYTMPGGSSNTASDGAAALINSLYVLSGGWPIQIVNLSLNGTPSDQWALDGSTLTATATLGGSSGAYTLSATAPVTAAFCPGGVLSYYASANCNITNSNAILAGSLTLTANGVPIVQDANANAGLATTNPGTTCTGLGAYAGHVSSCSINYLTGSISAAFDGSITVAPSGPLKAQWTDLLDSTNGSVATISPQYDGYGLMGTGAAASGLESAIMAKAPGGFTAMIREQCNANETEVGVAPGSYPPNGAHSQTAKWSHILNDQFPATFGQYSALTPVLSLGYGRDVVAFGSVAVQHANGCLVWDRDFATGYGDTASTFSGGNAKFQGSAPIGFGGSEIDHAVQQTATYGTPSPHETTGVFGGQRMGRQWAANFWSFFNSASITAEPTVSSVAFDNASTYNAACSATHYTCIDITFSLNAAGATELVTCGTGLSGGAFPPAGTCVPADYTTNAVVQGFRIGPSALHMYYNDGFEPYQNQFDFAASGTTNNYEFSCTLVAAAVVQCVKAQTANPWVSGGTVLSYGDMQATARSGTLIGPQTGSGYAIANAGGGTCTGAASQTIAMTGGTGTAPTIKFTLSGGSITAAVPIAAGFLTGGTPVVAYPPACTTPSITGAAVGTNINDGTLMGELLYDNSATIGGATVRGVYYGGGSAVLSNPCPLSGYCEPGNPATPLGIINPFSVSG